MSTVVELERWMSDLLRQRDEWANYALQEGMRVEAALAALRVISGPADKEPLMDVYRAAGGGYEGLQAVACHALAKDAQLAAAFKRDAAIARAERVEAKRNEA